MSGEIPTNPDHWFLKDVVSVAVSVLTAYITAKWVSKIGRQETRRTEVTSVLEDISVKASSYWRAGGIDRSRETELTELFDRFWIRSDEFFDFAKDRSKQNDIDISSRVLHAAATGGAFATYERVADSAVEKRVKLLAKELQNKVSALPTSIRLTPNINIRWMKPRAQN